jgi:hypothetical protein
MPVNAVTPENRASNATFEAGAAFPFLEPSGIPE